MRECALFAGGGGGILGGKLLGWRCVVAVEYAAYPRQILLARQADGALPAFPIWDDVRTFDGRPWRGSIDVISGGFPCQDISIAGGGDGLDGERSGLWSEFARIIGEIQPRFAFVENSPMLTSRGLDRVLADLSALGYDAEWGVMGAVDAGAPHKRERIWILAYAVGKLADTVRRRRVHWEAEERPACRGFDAQREPITSGEDVAHTESIAVGSGLRQGEPGGQRRGRPSHSTSTDGGWWSSEPGLGRVAYGMADTVDRLTAAGNGQVPHVAALAWNTLYARIEQRQRTNQQPQR